MYLFASVLYYRLLVCIMHMLTKNLTYCCRSCAGRCKGRRWAQVQAEATARASLHPAAQSEQLHRAVRLLEHHGLPEPPALACAAARRQPTVAAALHAAANPVAGARGLRPLLLHLPLLHSGRRPRAGSPATPDAQIGRTQPPALK